MGLRKSLDLGNPGTSLSAVAAAPLPLGQVLPLSSLDHAGLYGDTRVREDAAHTLGRNPGVTGSCTGNKDIACWGWEVKHAHYFIDSGQKG